MAYAMVDEEKVQIETEESRDEGEEGVVFFFFPNIFTSFNS